MMNDLGVMTAPRTVRIERALPGPIERVWAYLTEPDKRGAWLAGGPIELKEGGKVRLEFMHTNLTPEPFPSGSSNSSTATRWTGQSSGASRRGS